MRIIYIGDATSIHVIEWAKYFSGCGYEVHIISDNFNSLPDLKIHYISQCLYKPHLPLISATLQIAIKIIKIRKLVNTIKPDIIHAHYATNYGFLSSFFKNIPLVLTCHGSDILIDYEKKTINKIFIKKALKRADIITAPSHNMKNKIIHILKSTSPKIVKIQYGIDIDKFKFKFDLDKGIINIISTRSLEKKYRIETLIEALKILEEKSKLNVLIIGSGSMEKHLKKMVDNYNLRDYIKFYGKIGHNDIPKYYSSSHIYISTSPSDGLSISLLEAFASGCYPILPNIPANKELVKMGFNLKLYEVNNPFSLSTVIEDTLKKINYIKKDIFKNRTLVEKHFDRNKNMKKIEEIYKHLISV